jgi:hypothetical protein
MCPSDGGAVFVWPKYKRVEKKGFFFGDKKITSKQYEYFYPFGKLTSAQVINRRTKRKCTCAVFASSKLVEDYNERFVKSKRKTRVNNILVCISGDGHLKVLVESVFVGGLV